MKKQFKIFFVWIVYRCEINKRYYSEKEKKTRWYFRLYPRKIPMTILLIILTPFAFIITGLEGIIQMWKNPYKAEAWSSYEIWSIEKPKNSECYAKF